MNFKELTKPILNSQEQEFNYNSVYSRTLVDLTKPIMLPPTALGIGYHNYKGNEYLNNTFSYGEFSTIVARSKSKKTFCKSSYIAGFIGGKSDKYFSSFKTQRQGEPHIIDIDTEQGEYYAQRAFRRVTEMVGESYNNYYPFGVEELEPEEIVKFIDSLFNDPRHKGKIKWLSIDGIADLVKNTNDIIESVAVATKLKKWRKENNCHIQNIIHKISGGDKATGHLGSYVQKKSETVIDLRDTNEDPKVKNSPIEVVQSYSRGAPFDPYYFKINEEALPYECDNDIGSWT